MLGEERRKSMEGLEKGWRDGKRNGRDEAGGMEKRRKVDIPMLPEAAACGPRCETSFND